MLCPRAVVSPPATMNKMVPSAAVDEAVRAAPSTLSAGPVPGAGPESSRMYSIGVGTRSHVKVGLSATNGRHRTYERSLCRHPCGRVHAYGPPSRRQLQEALSGVYGSRWQTGKKGGHGKANSLTPCPNTCACPHPLPCRQVTPILPCLQVCRGHSEAIR